jgi:Isocitrate/isopropylmalate dehydrogenase
MRTARRSGAAEGIAEIACRTETNERRICRHVAEYAFLHARQHDATVFGGPKFAVSPIYEGMLKEEMDDDAARYPDVDYDPQLIDATYAPLLSATSDKPVVIPSLNRDGDCLSDLVMQLFRLDRGRGVAGLGVRRGPQTVGGNGRGTARYGAPVRGQERRESARDDSRRRSRTFIL